MNLHSSILLGILQGLTEFLPVSSSGHLVIAKSFIPNFPNFGVLPEVVLHVGTLLAAMVYFRKFLLNINSDYLLFIIVGSIPAALAGFLFQDVFESFFASTKLVAFSLFVTAGINFFTHKIKPAGVKIKIKDSFFVGIAQALAIIPGISRTGSTIFTSSFRGISKEESARFSFLLSIPAVIGANILQVLKYGLSDNVKFFYFTSFVAAFVSGYLAISIVFKFLKGGRFKFFAVYCFLLGIFTLFFR